MLSLGTAVHETSRLLLSKLYVVMWHEACVKRLGGLASGNHVASR